MVDLSIIVPVLNEQDGINALLQHLEPFAHRHDLEVIVVDGDRAQSTLTQIDHDYPWLVTTTAYPGRGSQMNQGAKVAQGSILLFLHADTFLPANGLANIVQLLENPDIQGGAHDLAINSSSWLLRGIAHVASLRSRLTRVPYGDQVIFVRRSVFQALGGYPNIPILEDVAFMKKLKQRQAHIHILRDPVCISDRRWTKEGILFTTLRNWLLLTLFELGVSPHQLARWYKPHQPEKLPSTARQIPSS